MRQSLANIALGFDKLPPLAGNAGKWVRINATGTGLEAVANPFTANDILASLKTVDGYGSGLDADLLQGNGFVAGGNYFGGIPRVSNDGVMEIGKYIDFHEADAAADDYSVRLTAQGGALHVSGPLYANGALVATIGGGGLNADTFDGADSSAFMAWRGQISGAASMDGATANGFYDVLYPGSHSEGLLTFTSGGSLGTFQLLAGHWGALSWRNRTDGSSWQPWRTLWHSGNDGSGSGLDADLLDGFEAQIAPVGFSIVTRDASGYVYGTYLNQSSPNSENPALISQVLVTNGADGFLRKADLYYLRDKMGFAVSPTVGGYQKFPGGLILQWGRTGTIGTDSQATVTFPTPFPNACLNVMVTAYSTVVDAGGAYHVCAAGDFTTTTFLLTNDSQSNVFHWLAIGY